MTFIKTHIAGFIIGVLTVILLGLGYNFYILQKQVVALGNEVGKGTAAFDFINTQVQAQKK